MFGNLIMLTVSWFLLKLRKQDLSVLLNIPLLLGILQLVAGFLATAFLAGFINGIYAIVSGFSWGPAEGVSLSFILHGLYKTFNNVLFEELLFRGGLLYLGITWIGEKKANLTSALGFGVYHWFTFGVFGNPMIMLWVLVFTGLWGLMFAYAYSRTGSIALPVGLHWGWNFIDQIIFNERGLFKAVTNIHTRYLSTLEEMLYLHLPALAFAVILIVLLCQNFSSKVKRDRRF